MSFDAAEQRGFNRRTKRIDSDTRSVEPGASMSTTETKVTHTPGPWKIADYTTYGEHGFQIVNERSGVHGHVAWVGKLNPDARLSPNVDEARANANVLAAAPDMLEALERVKFALAGILKVYGIADSGSYEREAIQALEQAEKAIAKARIEVTR